MTAFDYISVTAILYCLYLMVRYCALPIFFGGIENGGDA